MKGLYLEGAAKALHRSCSLVTSLLAGIHQTTASRRIVCQLLPGRPPLVEARLELSAAGLWNLARDARIILCYEVVAFRHSNLICACCGGSGGRAGSITLVGRS